MRSGAVLAGSKDAACSRGSMLRPIVAGGEGGQHSVLRLLLDFLPERVKMRLLEFEVIIVAGHDGGSGAADETNVADLITFGPA
eukprot:CAMPEP_0194305790 /NCGR_PEP_ID=MMETSP0171-20130528/3140_1 /TAXON_ID=218684 /ORGANISM="Corethron pennatum, Strain L29A3" /LENGTH=83 /DNA_ID=CAMNT_0039057417 /DNA_START=667 /DNA_END=914 /DNA_ORIENTATION=-